MSTDSPASDPVLNAKSDPYAALRYFNFSTFLAGLFAGNIGMLMQTTALTWDLYLRTGRADAIGMVGLVQIVPVIVLTIPAGQISDVYDRRRVLQIAQSLVVISAIALALVSLRGGAGPVPWMYLCIFFNAVGRSFAGPARSSLLPQLVSREHLPNAVTWSISGFQLASTVGPAAAGVLIWRLNTETFPIKFADPSSPIYFIDAMCCVIYLTAVSMLRLPPIAPRRPDQTVSFQSMVDGARFVWKTKLVLMAMTLDLFAVLLGGAVALLPIYAEDILKVGAYGQGLMRTSTAVGALSMSILVAHMPPMKQAGKFLLGAVALFGVATIVFGISRNFYLSLAMLFVLGATDLVSVIIRHTLVQTLTPDALRGRVTAVNSLFIGMSNELGDAESGFVAQALARPLGIVAATTWTVVGGGIGTILVVLAVAGMSKELRGLKRLQDATLREKVESGK